MPNIERQDEFIRSLGVEAYRVGGSVRDEILGGTPKDADYIVRGATLDVLHAILLKARIERGRPKGDRIVPLADRQGQQFGWRYAGIEIALPRREENAGDGRKQRIVADPNLTLAEDAERRDFTFNALYKVVDGIDPDHSVDVIDPTGYGFHDLRHRIIRTTHPDSFRDDPLRMLRALRFVSTLDADLADETERQMASHYEALTGLTHKGFTSGTVFDEFSKLLMGQKPGDALRLAALLGPLEAAMPELAAMIGFEQGSRYHDLTTDEHTFVALDTAAKVDAPLRVRWALLFHDAGKPEAAWMGPDGNMHYYRAPWFSPSDGADRGEDHEVVSERLWREAAKRMNVPRNLTDEVATLIREHMVSISTRAPHVKVARMRVKLGDNLLRDLFLHRMCDLSGKGSGKVAQDQIRHIAMLEGTRVGQQQMKVPTSVRDLAIDGNDCYEVGLSGRDIGLALRDILDEVVCDPSPLKRSRDWQLRRLEGKHEER